jgi:thiamine pyrophosphokinase
LPALRVMVVADGDPDPVAMNRMRRTEPGSRPTVIAADGGAVAAETAGWLPDRIVGDADSLGVSDVARYRSLGVDVDVHPPDKDESDTELAIEAALALGHAQIRVLGALGGARIEHAIANVLLLADPRLDGRDVAIEGGASTIRRIGTREGPGSIEIRGAAGDYVSLLPLDAEVTGIRTDGLRFPLENESLTLGPTRGLSNELVGEQGTVRSASGRLLVVQTPRAAGAARGDRA